MRKVASTQPGWYRGDLHAHSIHSDGSWDIPQLTQFMRSRGFYEWRLGIKPGMDINRIMQQVIDRDELLIIAHPMSPDEPFCSGCLWQFEDARPGVALGVEIWNGFWSYFNEEALQQYYVWLKQGHRLVVTSGSDLHESFPLDTPRRSGFNVVYAEQLSEEAVLRAVRQGRSCISAGPELLLTATTAPSQTVMMGDFLPAEAVTLKAAWYNAHEGDMLRLIVDGQVKEQFAAGVEGQTMWSLEEGQLTWATVELREVNNDLWAVTNPIYFGEQWL